MRLRGKRDYRDFIRRRKISGQSVRRAAHLREFMVDAGTRVDHQSDAGRSRGSVKRSDFLGDAILEQVKIVLRQSAHLRAVRRGNRAGYLHQRNARTYGAFAGRRGRIFRGGVQFTRNRIAFECRAMTQWLRAREFLRFCGCRGDQEGKNEKTGESKASQHATSMPDVRSLVA
jgi:hypothetical protein